MVYGLWFPIYVGGIKPERKWCLLQNNAGIIWGLSPMLSNYTSIDEFGQCLVLFYNQFHYRICFNDFQYEIRF